MTKAEARQASEVMLHYANGTVLIDFPKNGWCHLVADSIPILHSFAQNIGLNKCWFQNKRKKNKPHYDIKGAMIDKAIKAGAKQVDSRNIVKFLRQQYG